jgi:lysophospholipase L1-like esterase
MIVLTNGCTNPAKPSGTLPAISCPGPVSVHAIMPTGAPVTFSEPTVTGGLEPVTTYCTPASGSSFPNGITEVTCVTSDALQRLASCRFNVTVARPPRLTATRFLAFGDSITAGALGTQCPAGGGVNCSITTLTMPRFELRRFLEGLFIGIEATPAAYPRALQALLAARYPLQSFAIANEGLPGEFVADGKTRLAGLLNQQPPEALLLQEGANDMNQGQPPIDTIVEDLRSMVRAARGRGLPVFVGTLVPQRQMACRGYDFCDGTEDTVPTNARIRAMATAEGAVLVDLFTAFDGQTTTLLGLDGLHPNEAGYQKIAEMFFDAIRLQLEREP